MRRVFPLKQADNCSYGDTEDSQRKPSEKLELEADNKYSTKKELDEHICAVAAKVSDDAEKLINRLLVSCDSSVASGDENVPAANIINNKEVVAVRSFSNQKPPRAAAYPVFTAGASHRYTNPYFSGPLEKARQTLSSEKRRSTSFSSHISSDSQAELVKENENNNRYERPLSAPKNRPLPDTSNSREDSSLRTQSLRLTKLPDSVTLPDGGDEGPCYTASDRHLVRSPFHTRSSQATSERSMSESSDFSSVFSKATESSSSRTLASVSPCSKKTSVVEKPGRGSSPFKYLSARMVAEKLVKVLGKDKLRPQLNKAINSHIQADNGMDMAYVVSQKQAATTEATVRNMYSKGSSIPSEYQAKQNSTGSSGVGDEPRVLQKDIHPYDHYTISARLTKGNAELNSRHAHNLEGRALVIEEVAKSLDKENNAWERKHSSGSLADYPVEGTAQDFKYLRGEISKLRKEKKELALEVAGEIRARMFEQNAAANQLKRLRLEMDAKVSAVEKDKEILQETLERELESRGEEWNAKLEKMKVEERKMGERVKQMAEDQIELQKVVAALKEKEASWKADAKNFECLLSNLKQRMKASEAEMLRQVQASAETANRLKASDAELELVSQRNAYLEMESSEMQKEVTRLRRVCNDQEMTVEGLWQELDEAVNGTFDCKSESLLRLQRELLRLAGVEQRLRNEISATHAEMTRLKEDKDVAHVRNPADLVRLNQELQDKVGKLQSKAAVLQEENQKLSLSLRAAVRAKRDSERALKISQFEEANRTKVNLKASERAADREDASINRKETDERGKPLRHTRTDESLRVLNSKLQSREAELERLDKEIIEVINTKDSLQMEVDDLYGKLILANQRIRELERQVEKKEGVIEELQADVDNYKKEFANLQVELPRIRRQRDEMHKEAEDMSREALRLSRELHEAKKTAEKLEEEVMLKEGQISILRGAYGNCDYSS